VCGVYCLLNDMDKTGTSIEDLPGLGVPSIETGTYIFMCHITPSEKGHTKQAPGHFFLDPWFVVDMA
jgi:hypothetical protein